MPDLRSRKWSGPRRHGLLCGFHKLADLLEKQRNFQGPDAPCRPPSPRTSWRGRRHACRLGQDATDFTTGGEPRNQKKSRNGTGTISSRHFCLLVSAGSARRISSLPHNSPFVRQYVMVSTSFVQDGLT